MAKIAAQSFPRRRHAHTAVDQAAFAAQRKAEEEARVAALYGDALLDAHFLRKRGFVVTSEKDGFRVGNKLLSRDEMKAMAARERSVAGEPAAKATSGGLKVGDTVALKARPNLANSSQSRPRTSPAMAVMKAAKPVAGPVHAPKPKAAEHSTDLGTKPRVVWLDLGLLTVDRRYQREINTGGDRHINRILKAFNWNCYQPIIVTEGADGIYAVVDGQHRLEAAKKHPLIDSLPCYIIDAPDVAQQAQIFVEVNSNRKGLTSSQKFWASHAAGEATATALAAICKDAGVTILRGPPGGHATPPLSILGPLVAQRLVAKFGPGPVREAIRLLADTHSKTAGAFRSSTISALTRLAADKSFVRERLRAVLAATDLDKLHGESSTLAKGGGVGSLTLGTERLLRAKLVGAA